MKFTLKSRHIGLFLVMTLLLVGSSNIVQQTAAQPANERNKVYLTDTSDESIELIDLDYITNPKIDSMLSGNQVEFETQGLIFDDYSIDTTETSIGLDSNDWIGNPSDPSSGAKEAQAGEGYWILNGSTSPVNEKSSQVDTLTTNPTTTYFDPSSGGFYWQNTIYAPADTDTDYEYQFAYNALDQGSLVGVDWSVDSTSYLYFNAELTATWDNATSPIGTLGIYFIVSDGNTNYILGAAIAQGTTSGMIGGAPTTADDTFVDLDIVTDSDGVSPVAATGARVYVEEAEAASGSAYDLSYLWNIQDMINSDPESADRITAKQIKGFFVGYSHKFTDTADATFSTVKIKQMMFGSEYDFMIFDDSTDISSMSTTDKSQNLINGSTVAVDLNKWQLFDSLDLFPRGTDVNRLTIASSAVFYLENFNQIIDVIQDVGTRVFVKRIDYFDLQIGAEEPEVGMWSGNGMDINVTNLDDSWELDFSRGAITTDEALNDGYYLTKSADLSVDASNFGTLVDKSGDSYTDSNKVYDQPPDGPWIIDMVANYEIDEGDDNSYQITTWYSVDAIAWAEYLDAKGAEQGIGGRAIILGKTLIALPVLIPLIIASMLGFKFARNKKAKVDQWRKDPNVP